VVCAASNAAVDAGVMQQAAKSRQRHNVSVATHTVRSCVRARVRVIIMSVKAQRIALQSTLKSTLKQLTFQ
jgi:hypothetical protein